MRYSEKKTLPGTGFEVQLFPRHCSRLCIMSLSSSQSKRQSHMKNSALCHDNLFSRSCSYHDDFSQGQKQRPASVYSHQCQ